MKSQVECGGMVAQEKRTEQARDLVNHQRIAAKQLLDPATNQLLTVLCKNWLDQS